MKNQQFDDFDDDDILVISIPDDDKREKPTASQATLAVSGNVYRVDFNVHAECPEKNQPRQRNFWATAIGRISTFLAALSRGPQKK